jgi:hypothetical protein
MDRTKNAHPSKEILFQRLKPPCVQLSKDLLRLSQPEGFPKEDEPFIVNDVEQLQQIIHSIDKQDEPLLKTLTGYILFPLESIMRVLARQEEGTVIKLAIIKLYTSLFKRVSINQKTVFLHAVTFLESLRSNYQTRMDNAMKEDLVLASLECEITLLECLEDDVQDLLWKKDEGSSEDPSLILAHSLGTTIDLMETTRNKDLRYQCCRLIQTWACITRESTLLKRFLPGVMSGLIKLIMAAEREFHNIGISYIETLSIYVRKALANEKAETLLEFTRDGSSLYQRESDLCPCQHGL